MPLMSRVFFQALFTAAMVPVAFAADEAAAASKTEPVLGLPTLHSIGMHWIIAGDANQNAQVRVTWRSGNGAWHEGQPLLRVEKDAQKPEKGHGSIDVPEGARLYAGSLLLLQPNMNYEIKLSLVDPDGGSLEKILKAHTAAEPTDPKGATVYHVAPGDGGSRGTAAAPFLGLKTAEKHAQPGTIFLLHAGTYPAETVFKQSGEPGQPIIWRAAGDGEVIFDGTAPKENADRLITASELHDVWFEGLTLRHADKGLVGNGSARIVVRGCHLSDVEYGIVVTRNEGDTVRGWFVADNVIEGISTWPRTKGIENARGIQITGEGHDICYNRIRGFADAIDTFPSPRCTDIDFHHNELTELTDDGMELDYSERNVRCFENRLTNVFQGISTQPVFGGPVYIFRNALYNVGHEPFKLHNSPSGVLIYHNTVVKHEEPISVQTGAPIRNSRMRNNLFIGHGGPYAFESSAKMKDCDFDYGGFGGGPWKMFLKWNNERYATPDEAKAKAPAWKHTVILDAAATFAQGTLPPADEKPIQKPMDLRLKTGSAAIDAGEVLPGVNDSFAGKAPDLGAYEWGAELPAYGPRK